MTIGETAMRQEQGVASPRHSEKPFGRRSATPRRHLLALAFVVLACAMLLFALPGCKYSDVLTERIEDPEKGVLDENAEPIYKSNPDAEERPDLADVSVDESNDENTQVQTLPHYDPNAPDNGPTLQRLKSPETPHDEEATEGESDEEDEQKGVKGSDTDESDDKDDTGDEKGDDDKEGGGNEEDQSDDEDDTGDNEGTGDELTSDEADDQTESDESGDGGDTVVVDDDGTTDETSKGTVAAVGEYATIAQMLGGAGALAACDEQWLDDRGADGSFAGELDRVQAAFAGDGTEDGSCDVDALVNTIKPSVVLWDSSENVPALSSGERAQLEEAGISVQAVPHIGEQTTEDSTVTSAVQEVAAVLQGASGIEYDPVEMYSSYSEFHDEVLTSCYDANDGYSYKVTDSQYAYLYQDSPLSGLSNSTTTRIATAYIDSIMVPGVSQAEVAQTATVSEGTIALAHDGQVLDVSDGVGLSATTNTSGYMLIDYYLQLAGVMNNAYDSAQPESQGRPYIVMPGNTNAFGKSGRFASRISSSALFYNAGDGSVASNWHVLGNDDFPALLASSTEVAEAIANSASKDDGLYRMESGYRVIVVPTGVGGSWSEGHVDSFLLAPWAFRIGDEGNLSAAADIAQDFYEFFMRGSLDSAVTDWDSAYSV